MKRIVVSVTGRVQGVGYRYYVTDCAQQNDIRGYVRNMPDGSVQVTAEGSDDSLREFIRHLHASGDPLICVNAIKVEYGVPTGEFSEFGIKS